MSGGAYLAAAVGWMALIFLLSSLPGAPAGADRFVPAAVTKLLHVVLYGVLALLLYRSLKRGGRTDGSAVRWSLVLAACYAASDELHQLYTPGRFASVLDVFIDIFGAALFLAGERRAAAKTPKERPGHDDGKTADRG